MLDAPSKSFSTVMLTLAIFSLTLSALVAIFFAVPAKFLPAGFLPAIRPNELFGPFDAPGALFGVLGSLTHTVILSALVYGLFLWQSRSQHRLHLAAVCLLLTSFELALANGWMVRTAPGRHWETESAVAERIDSEVPERVGPVRVHRGSMSQWVPSHFARTRSVQRQTEGLDWDRDTLFPKYAMSSRPALSTSLLEAPGSMISSDLKLIMSLGRSHGFRRRDGVPEPDADLLEALGTQFVVLPGDDQLIGAERVTMPPSGPVNASLWKLRSPRPTAWIVHDVTRVPPVDRRDPVAHRTYIQEIFLRNGRVRDLSQVAFVEAEDARADLPTVAIPKAASQESCSVDTYQPDKITLRAVLTAPGLLVIAERFDPGWVAEVSSTDASASRRTVWRTNALMRGIFLPAGEHRVTLRYRPNSLVWGGTISLVAWLTVLVLVIWATWSFLRQRKPKLSNGQI